MDRNEKQNSYKNMTSTRGNGKKIRKLTKANRILGAALVVALAVTTGTGIGYTRLKKDYQKALQENAQRSDDGNDTGIMSESKNTESNSESETDNRQTEMNGLTETDDQQTETNGLTETGDQQTETNGLTETDNGQTETNGITETDNQQTETNGLTETDHEQTETSNLTEGESETTAESESASGAAAGESGTEKSGWKKRIEKAKEKLKDLIQNENIDAEYCIAPVTDQEKEATNIDIEDLSKQEEHLELSSLFVLGTVYQNLQHGISNDENGKYNNDKMLQYNKVMLGREKNDEIGVLKSAADEIIKWLGSSNPDGKAGEAVVLDFINSVKFQEGRTDRTALSPEEYIEFFKKEKAGDLIQDDPRASDRLERMENNLVLPSADEEAFSGMNAMLDRAENDGNKVCWAGENTDGYQYLAMLVEMKNDENSYILYLKAKNENNNVQKILESVYECMQGENEPESEKVQETGMDTADVAGEVTQPENITEAQESDLYTNW